jgi:hypothetical protein
MMVVERRVGLVWEECYIYSSFNLYIVVVTGIHYYRKALKFSKLIENLAI